MCDQRKEALAYCFPKEPAEAERIIEDARYITEKTGVKQHDLLLVLGSGLVNTICGLGTERIRFPISDFASVPVPAAEGHGKELVSLDVKHGGKTHHLLVCTGRSHLYEGYDPQLLCRLARICAMTGVKAAFLTNAGGCLHDWNLGDVMAITDHVNLSGASPFNGPVFVDIWQIWDAELTAALRRHTSREGIYAILRGPEFQTKAESVMMRSNGIDMVGMSTILEAIALHQLGVRVCGISVTSDLSFSDTPTEHNAVLNAVRNSLPCVRECVLSVLDKIG